jgi:2-haloalkanoic acid dehalogenase type II
MADQRPYDVITFDCYGTLIDWEGGIREAFRDAAVADRVPVDPDAALRAMFEREPEVQAAHYRTYREVLTLTAMEVGAQLGWKMSRERAAFLPESLPRWKPFPDTNAALERLSRSGYELGILSNVDDDLLASTRRHFTVSFPLLVTAQQVGSYKPAHGHFTTARERIDGRRWLHAAQSYFHDITPAVANKVPVAWINRKSMSPAGAARADRELKTLTELADWLA